MPGVISTLIPEMTSSINNSSFRDLSLSIGPESRIIQYSIGFHLHKIILSGSRPSEALVKVHTNLPPMIFTSEEERCLKQQYLKEMERWKSVCSNKHFVTILGLCQFDDQEVLLPCPVYKETILSRELFPNVTASAIMHFIAKLTDGVAYMHENNFIHGDIRGDNIVVNEDGFPRICDNSLTAITGILDKMHRRAITEVCGAIRWMPIEDVSLEGDAMRKPTREGDIWSLGMTIFEIWSGQKPYSDTPTERVGMRIMNGQLPSIRTGSLPDDREAIRESISVLTSLCWVSQPENRVKVQGLVKVLKVALRNGDITEFKVAPQQYSPTSASISSFRSPLNAASASNPSPRSMRATGSSPSTNNSYTAGRRQEGISTETEGYPSSETPSYTESIQSERSTTSMYEQDPTELIRSGPPRPVFLNFSPRNKLTNFAVQNCIDLVINKPLNYGKDHLPVWVVTIDKDGYEIARASSSMKKRATEEASTRAMNILRLQYPDSPVQESDPYLPVFRNFKDKLNGRVQIISRAKGESHDLDWFTDITLDGRVICRGEGKSKKASEENAALRAYDDWPRQ